MDPGCALALVLTGSGMADKLVVQIKLDHCGWLGAAADGKTPVIIIIDGIDAQLNRTSAFGFLQHGFVFLFRKCIISKVLTKNFMTYDSSVTSGSHTTFSLAFLNR